MGDEDDTETEEEVSEAEDQRLEQDAEEFRKSVKNNWEASEYEQSKS